VPAEQGARYPADRSLRDHGPAGQRDNRSAQAQRGGLSLVLPGAARFALAQEILDGINPSARRCHAKAEFRKIGAHDVAAMTGALHPAIMELSCLGGRGAALVAEEDVFANRRPLTTALSPPAVADITPLGRTMIIEPAARHVFCMH